jgi:hypothetical protein
VAEAAVQGRHFSFVMRPAKPATLYERNVQGAPSLPSIRRQQFDRHTRLLSSPTRHRNGRPLSESTSTLTPIAVYSYLPLRLSYALSTISPDLEQAATMFRAQSNIFDDVVVKATDENLTSENWEYILVRLPMSVTQAVET